MMESVVIILKLMRDPSLLPHPRLPFPISGTGITELNQLGPSTSGILFDIYQMLAAHDTQ